MLAGPALPHPREQIDARMVKPRRFSDDARALLKSSFRALRRITLCPQRIGHIVAAALVILTMHRGRW